MFLLFCFPGWILNKCYIVLRLTLPGETSSGVCGWGCLWFSSGLCWCIGWCWCPADSHGTVPVPCCNAFWEDTCWTVLAFSSERGTAGPFLPPEQHGRPFLWCRTPKWLTFLWTAIHSRRLPRQRTVTINKTFFIETLLWLISVVELEKAFDCVTRIVLWGLLQENEVLGPVNSNFFTT